MQINLHTWTFHILWKPQLSSKLHAIRKFEKLKFSKSTKCICKVNQNYYFKRGRGTWRINFLNDSEFNKMQLYANIPLIPSGSFGIFLRNLKSQITSKFNLLNLIIHSWRFKSLVFSKWVKHEVNFFRKLNQVCLPIPMLFGNWTLP